MKTTLWTVWNGDQLVGVALREGLAQASARGYANGYNLPVEQLTVESREVELEPAGLTAAV